MSTRRSRALTDHHFDPQDNLIDANRFNQRNWLLTSADNDYLLSIMKPVHEPGNSPHRIAPPDKKLVMPLVRAFRSPPAKP